mmetsp:Transcript_17538/g.39555  ORF Transcript_17538/g.39555 Transcript_17538/m.39555 type:complete len:91 (+) Transcript_17538:1868-2140(+)
MTLPALPLLMTASSKALFFEDGFLAWLLRLDSKKKYPVVFQANAFVLGNQLVKGYKCQLLIYSSSPRERNTTEFYAAPKWRCLVAPLGGM